MKCRRPKCDSVAANGGRLQGLCNKHYLVAPRGYVDSARATEHLLRLNQAGFSWRQIAQLSGMSEQGLYGVRDGTQVQVETEKRILAIPAPEDKYAGRGLIDSTGSQRRIRALVALGWPQRKLEDHMGTHPRRLSIVLQRQKIYTPLARLISDCYDELSMTLGPSNRSRVIAQRKGWPVPLCWDDIDDPNETPSSGVAEVVPFRVRYRELRETGETNQERMARRLGISLESLKRQITRHRLEAS